MASSRYAREGKDAGRAAGAPPPRPGRGLLILTLLLALYAAGASTMLLMQGGGSGGGGGGGGGAGGASTPSGDALTSALDAQARRVRGEVKEDLEKAQRQSEERVARAVKQVEEARDTWKVAVESGVKRADDVVRNAAVRADELDGKIDDVQRSSLEFRTGIDGLKVAVKELQSRPIATAPAAAPPVSGPVKPPEAGPEKPPEAPAGGPTMSKEVVRAKIAELADPDWKKVVSACVTLGKSGDLEAVEPLAKVLREHKESMPRVVAASALGTLKACDGVPALLNAFLDKQTSVFLAASAAFGNITGFDSGLDGGSRVRAKEEAKTKAGQFWAAHEAEIREKLGQPKSSGAPPPSEGGGDGK